MLGSVGEPVKHLGLDQETEQEVVRDYCKLYHLFSLA